MQDCHEVPGCVNYELINRKIDQYYPSVGHLKCSMEPCQMVPDGSGMVPTSTFKLFLVQLICVVLFYCVRVGIVGVFLLTPPSNAVMQYKIYKSKSLAGS